LNAIIGFSEMMAQQTFGPIGNSHYLSYAGDILQSGRHLLSIINGVLDLAKSQTGKLTIHAEPVDLCETLNDCANMMRDQCARGGVALETVDPGGALLVAGEPAKLRQIFLNLLSNAVKFTEPGGRVTLQAFAPRDGAIVVEVRDTGIGMSAQEIPIALAPFGQVDSRLARRYDGTGLGLPLAKELVDLHGGELAIDSTPGKGTSVRVTFPVASESVIPALTSAAA
jgi:signal transduction histidine kinase